MVYKRTIQTQSLILEVLACEKEIAQYDLPQRVQKDYTTVLRRLRNLEEQRLVKVARTKGSAKGGKDKKIYAVTLKGLFVALRNPSLWKNIDKIADYHKDRLEIFKEWENFTNTEKEVIRKQFELIYARDEMGLLTLDFEALIYPEDVLREHIDNLLLGSEVQYFKELYDIMKRNPNLRKKHLIKLHEERKMLKKFMDNVEHEIAELESFS